MGVLVIMIMLAGGCLATAFYDKPEDCSDISPGPVENGDFWYNGFEAHMWCDVGHNITGNAWRRCVMDTTGKPMWDGEQPDCVEMPECNGAPGSIGNGDFWYNEYEAVYWCEYGYELQGIDWLTCKGNNEWSNFVPTCKKLPECLTPLQIQNGHITWNDKFEAFYACDFGYRFEEPRPAFCADNEMWTPPPVCKKWPCHPMPEPTNGHQIALDVAEGDNVAVSYACKYGYQLTGAAVNVCDRRTRQWSAPIPQCMSMAQCSDQVLDAPLGLTNGGLVYMDHFEAHYGCDIGYSLIGDPRITCRNDGTWNGAAMPICEPWPCAYPGDVSNGEEHVFTIPETGEIVLEYHCFRDRGYSLSGESRLRCDHKTRQWTSPKPSCVLRSASSNPSTAMYKKSTVEKLEQLRSLLAE